MKRLTLLPALALASCARERNGPPQPTPPPVPPAAPAPAAPTPRIVRVSPAGVIVLVGGSVPYEASSAQIPKPRWIWRVSDTTLARISPTGLLRARRPGTVFVQACDQNTSACGNTALTIMEVPRTPP